MSTDPRSLSGKWVILLARGRRVRFKACMSKSFRDWRLDQALLLPPSVHDFVPTGHLSRFVVALVTEELDLSAILASYNGEKGQPPYHPAMMVALLLYAYAVGIYSSRRVAKACVGRGVLL